MATYCATKFGVIGLVKSAASDLAPHNIRVNAVCPGVIDTPILGPIHGNAQMLEMFGPAHPIGRVGKPEEVADAIVWLASDRASFVTGQTIRDQFIDWEESNRTQLFAQFAQDYQVNPGSYDNWLYNYARVTDQPADIGPRPSRWRTSHQVPQT